MYPYQPQNEDELELVPGDFVFMSPVDQSSTSEGWVYGTSLASGLSGLLPENYVSLADESDTWVFHGLVLCLSFKFPLRQPTKKTCFHLTIHCNIYSGGQKFTDTSYVYYRLRCAKNQPHVSKCSLAILVQTFPQMLHAHHSIQLKTGCFSKMTSCTFRGQEYNKYNTFFFCFFFFVNR